MKRKVVNWSIEKLGRERGRISFPEYQREKQLWPDDRKRMLIDSIWRDIDIPKLYFNSLNDRDQSIEVIDGQQRLWSVWDFLDDNFDFNIDGKKRLFSEMSSSQRNRIEEYTFQVTMFEDAEEEYLRILFVRLQLGLLLNTGEKLHAATGRMKQLVFGKLADHPFIAHLGIPKRRFAKQTLCAQIAINSFSRAKLGEFARTRYDDLSHFFEEYGFPQGKDLDLFKNRSAEIPEVMDQLWRAFGRSSSDLRNRSYVLSLYLLMEEFVEKREISSQRDLKTFAEFSSKLWRGLKTEMGLGMDRRNRELYDFQTLLSSAPGEEYQIRRRHEKLREFYRHYVETGRLVGEPRR